MMCTNYTRSLLILNMFKFFFEKLLSFFKTFFRQEGDIYISMFYVITTTHPHLIHAKQFHTDM